MLARTVRIVGSACPRYPLQNVIFTTSASKTQAEVGAALGSDQAEMSKLERRPDMMLSTLRKYAEALGARCEIVFVFDKTGHRIGLSDPE